MRVIVTRPEPACHGTAKKLRRLGHDPILLPLFMAEHLHETVRKVLAQKPGGLVLTSAEATRALSSCGPLPDPWRDVPVHVVGETTGKAARAIGFADVHVSGGNGETLATLIGNATAGRKQPLLYLAGEPRSPGLEAKLRESGIAFETAVIYRMNPAEIPSGQLDAMAGSTDPISVLLYSREAALRFATIAESTSHLDQRIDAIFCLSPAIADALPADLQRRAKAANSPKEEQLLALLPAAET